MRLFSSGICCQEITVEHDNMSYEFIANDGPFDVTLVPRDVDESAIRLDETRCTKRGVVFTDPHIPDKHG